MKTKSLAVFVFLSLFLWSCSADAKSAPVKKAGLATATFAGGCFWCMEPPFEKLPGVVSVTSGYTGGRSTKPSYEEVSGGGSGHYEAVEVLYDPRKVSYSRLVDVFWKNVDPTDGRGQFCDKGEQYLAAIFVRGANERKIAEESKVAVMKNKRLTVVTPVLDVATFYAAEEYHQDYYKKNPVRYKFYRLNCGRDQRLAQIWGEAPAH